MKKKDQLRENKFEVMINYKSICFITLYYLYIHFLPIMHLIASAEAGGEQVKRPGLNKTSMDISMKSVSVLITVQNR